MARNQINFRVTEEEYAILLHKAEEAGLSPTKYAKQQALKGKVKAPVITKDIGKLILPDIAKIGSNVNQIARKLNQGGSPILSEFKEIQAEFETLWAYVLEGKKPKDVAQEQETGMKEEEQAKPEIPHCEICGAELVAGERKKDNSPIWFCPNWRDQEQGKHTILDRME